MLAALPGPGTAGASMLHFGCHGRAEVPVLHSRIRLGDDYLDTGQKRLRENLLRVGDILRQARAWRSGQRAVASSCGLVVLASCLSDVTDADYDEALTLATAFLSAGAGGVVAARWRVDISTTALLMAAFHRYLNAGAERPGRCGMPSCGCSTRGGTSPATGRVSFATRRSWQATPTDRT